MRRARSRWRWSQVKVRPGSSARQVCARRFVVAFVPGAGVPRTLSSSPHRPRARRASRGSVPFRSPVKNRARASGVLKAHDQVPDGLGRPGGTPARRRAQHRDPVAVDPVAVVPGHREHQHPRSGQGECSGKATGQQGFCLAAGEISPGRGRAFGCGADPGFPQGLPHRWAGRPSPRAPAVHRAAAGTPGLGPPWPGALPGRGSGAPQGWPRRLGPGTGRRGGSRSSNGASAAPCPGVPAAAIFAAPAAAGGAAARPATPGPPR